MSASVFIYKWLWIPQNHSMIVSDGGKHGTVICQSLIPLYSIHRSLMATQNVQRGTTPQPNINFPLYYCKISVSSSERRRNKNRNLPKVPERAKSSWGPPKDARKKIVDSGLELETWQWETNFLDWISHIWTSCDKSCTKTNRPSCERSTEEILCVSWILGELIINFKVRRKSIKEEEDGSQLPLL